jgi:hypothetical protein
MESGESGSLSFGEKAVASANKGMNFFVNKGETFLSFILCGADPDDALAYHVPKVVKIRSWPLGTKPIIMMGIAVEPPDPSSPYLAGAFYLFFFFITILYVLISVFVKQSYLQMNRKSTTVMQALSACVLALTNLILTAVERSAVTAFVVAPSDYSEYGPYDYCCDCSIGTGAPVNKKACG